MTNAFRQVRRLDLWKKAVKGAAWVLEVKIGTDGHWHPHLHCIAHAAYVGVGPLTQAWAATTGDSHIVHVKRITPDAAVTYITKYISKPLDASVIHSGRLDEYMLAMKGIRACATLGTWHKVKLSKPTEPFVAAEWESLGSLPSLLQQAEAGDAEATRIVQLLEVKCQRILSPPSTAPTGHA